MEKVKKKCEQLRLGRLTYPSGHAFFQANKHKNSLYLHVHDTNNNHSKKCTVGPPKQKQTQK